MKKLIFINIFLFLLFSRCANVVPLEGGKKDEISPKLKSTNLIPLSFNENEIKLSFNEYIEVENNNKNITLQPFHSTLSIRKNKKDIIIKIDSVLNENTTYVLNITNGIKDVNEGNLYSYFYTFSTGNKIDTGFLKFSINQSEELKNYKVGITDNLIDSFHKIKFNYISFFNQNNAIVNGLNTSKIFKYFVFKDENKDDKPDEFTPIYFDTTSVNKTLNIKLENWIDEKIKIVAYKNVTKYIKKNLAIYPENLNDSLLIYKNNDSALYFNFKPIDSLNELNITKEIKNLLKDKINAIKDKNNYIIQIPNIGLKNFSVLNYQVKKYNNVYEINSKSKFDSLKIILGNNDTQTIKIENYIDINKLSTLKFSLKEKEKKYQLIIYKNKQLIMHENLTQNNAVYYIEPGEYEIKILEENNSTKITANPYNSYIPKPAKVNKKIVLKANWEDDISL